jgi:hypothetical protein
MLEPHDRATLTDQLVPPPGYMLKRAVGTSFTLDLTTALSIPLSFASRRLGAETEPLGILDAVRRVADRIDIFAQAGEISMGNPSDLVAFLEPMIHPVQTNRGLFHPKIWFLEYEAGDERRYRFLSASRNLTEDRSWDVIVRLDGAIGDRETREQNDPLVRLLHELPQLATNPLPPARQREIEALATRISTVEWELPQGTFNLKFHALGVAGAEPLNFRGAKALVISPFVTDGGLDLVRSQTREETHLISRLETLERLAPETVGNEGLKTYILDDVASMLSEDAPVASRDRLTGLHAKAVIIEHGQSARVFLGSANATDAAWHSNIEMMVELDGPRSSYGVSATLDSLAKITEEYNAAGGAQETSDEKAAHRLETLTRMLASTRLSARILPDTEYGLRVWATPDVTKHLQQLQDNDVTLRWHLLTREDLGSREIATSERDAATIERIPLTDLTPFIVFVLRDADGNQRRTVVLAELLDDIEHRKDAIIVRQLTDRASFLRLLMLMLETSGGLSPLASPDGGSFTFGGINIDSDGNGLFESLVRAVGSRHEGLADVSRVIEFLRNHGEDRDLLPDGFEELWENVWHAQRNLSGGAK